jgi:hypothetical protein
MSEYQGNSRRSKVEQLEKQEHKVEKVISGQAIIKKKNYFDKIKSELISDDAKNLKSYVIGDVLIPALKKAISDIVTNGIDILLYGESKGRTGNGRSTADRVSYRSYYDNTTQSRPSYSRGSNYSYDDIILQTRGEAEDVLLRMDEIMDMYGLVRVADLYDLVGITGNFTDNKYGWTNIRNADIIRVRDGYMIKLPRAIPID